MKDGAPYALLVRHYLAHRATKFTEVLAAHGLAFHDDGTLGLLTQMRERLAASAVVAQTRTFLARPLADVAAAARLPDAAAARSLIAKCAPAAGAVSVPVARPAARRSGAASSQLAGSLAPARSQHALTSSCLLCALRFPAR